jgi:hypothetical protein
LVEWRLPLMRRRRRSAGSLEKKNSQITPNT